MNMDKKSLVLGFVLALFLVSAAFAAYGAFAHAQTPSGESSITFPVAELGNCGSKDACKSYCGDPANIEACVVFGKTHGLMNQEEASRAQKFAKTLQSSGGPGGCRSPQECDKFCSTLANLETCIKFAEEQGIKDENITEGKKIQSYLKSGGQMPGGCTSKDSCEDYCGDFSHAQECMEFAQKSGLEGPSRDGGPDKNLSSEQAQRLMQMTRNGETPGGCKNRQACESYCSNDANREECAKFMEKAGLMNAQEAEMMRKTGGKGPGGCNSKESCDAFCNPPANRETCFNFGKEHGLISEQDLKQMQEGMTRMRQGLDSAPPEVVACLKSTLGPNVIDQIQAGTLVPGPNIGDAMKGCFEKFGQNMSPRGEMNQMPPEMASCVKAKLGGAFDNVRSGQAEMTPEMGDAFRVCGEQMRLLDPNMQGGPNDRGGPGPNGERDPGPNGQDGSSSEGMRNFLRSAPQEIQSCLQNKLGGDFEALRSGTQQPGQDIREKMKSCFESFRPQDPQNMDPRQGQEPGQPDPNGIRPGGEGNAPNLPPGAMDCIKNAAGANAIGRMQSGQIDDTLRSAIQNCAGRSEGQAPQQPRNFREGEPNPSSPDNFPRQRMPLPSGEKRMPPSPGETRPGEPQPPINMDGQPFPGSFPPPPGSEPSGEMQSQVPMGTQLPMGSFVPPPTGETAPPPDYVKPPETTAPPTTDTPTAPPPTDTTTAPAPTDTASPAPTGGSILGIFARLLGI